MFETRYVMNNTLDESYFKG